MKGKYLITTDSWFIAPDGKQYKAVWGDVEILDDSVLGLKSNRMSTNWYAKIGTEKTHVIIAGCQIHYAAKCENSPNIDPVEDWSADATKFHTYQRPTSIYLAQ